MPITHIVKQGEYLSLIADSYGLHSFKKVWDDPANAELKKLRKNPNVLLPGDELVIPDTDKKEESGQTEMRHQFVLLGEPLALRLVIKNESAEPVADTPCLLDLDGNLNELRTDSSGKVQLDVPRSTRQGRLIIENEDLAIHLALPVGVGELDPFDTITGQIGRLNNLGYDAGDVQKLADAAATERFRSAVEEFQCNEKLKVDGVCGPVTQAKLRDVHGC